MPPLPEVGRISSQKWPSKVKWELKAQQLCATASDIGVTRKIEKDLHKESDATRPCGQPARVRRGIIEISVGYYRESVGKHHLLNQAAQNKNDAALDHNRRRATPVLNLRDELPCSNDWPRDEVREKRDEQCVIDEVSNSRHLSPIDIDRVGKAGESIEADAYRENNLQDNR